SGPRPHSRAPAQTPSRAPRRWRRAGCARGSRSACTRPPSHPHRYEWRATSHGGRELRREAGIGHGDDGPTSASESAVIVRPVAFLRACAVVMGVWSASIAHATTYEVGPGKPLANIGDVPWEALNAGDTVLIYARPTPYREKWVISRAGTAAAPIT